MKERLLEFLKAENKSSAQLAEEIGVQPSGISHILSGRNNPSLDFILKMLEKYQFLSTDWLMFGKGSMYKDLKMQTLFEELNNGSQSSSSLTANTDPEIKGIQEIQTVSEKLNQIASPVENKRDSRISRIIMFYDDNRFEEYRPKE